MERNNPYIGSSLDDFLKEEGILEETRDIVLKETLSWQAQKSIKKIKRN
jgi:antitoxin HicB